MFKKLVPGKSSSKQEPRNSTAEEASPTARPTTESPRDQQAIESLADQGLALAEQSSTEVVAVAAAEAEEGQRPPSAALTPSSSPPNTISQSLKSHPVTPDRSGGLSPVGASSSSPAGSNSANGNVSRSPSNGDFQNHLRKVTANLVDILDQISTSGSTAGSSKGKNNRFFSSSTF